MTFSDGTIGPDRPAKRPATEVTALLSRAPAPRFRIKRPLHLVRQRAPGDCGVASLSMVLRWHRRESNLVNLRSQLRVTPSGVSAADIVRVARKHYGLWAAVCRIKQGALLRATGPLILFCHPTHFVVFVKGHRTGAVVLDPDKGRCRLSLAELERVWSGVAIVIDHNKRSAIGRFGMDHQ
jgi:ATP-binding cassette, subfamily B, bacterial CvaB/MchF/RaxB